MSDTLLEPGNDVFKLDSSGETRRIGHHTRSSRYKVAEKLNRCTVVIEDEVRVKSCRDYNY